MLTFFLFACYTERDITHANGLYPAVNKLICGLGNKGKRYTDTRHNAGFQAVDFLADEWGSQTFVASSNAPAVVTERMVGGTKIKLAKPQTMMNKSGTAIRELSNYFSISPEHILILHDDVDLPIGSFRVSFASSAGGHNGVRSIINTLGTHEFTRLRIGIGPSNQKEGRQDIDTRAFVLGQFTDQQRQMLHNELPHVLEATTLWVKKGKEAAMNAVNG